MATSVISALAAVQKTVGAAETLHADLNALFEDFNTQMEFIFAHFTAVRGALPAELVRAVDKSLAKTEEYQKRFRLEHQPDTILRQQVINGGKLALGFEGWAAKLDRHAAHCMQLLTVSSTVVLQQNYTGQPFPVGKPGEPGVPRAYFKTLEDRITLRGPHSMVTAALLGGGGGGGGGGGFGRGGVRLRSGSCGGFGQGLGEDVYGSGGGEDDEGASANPFAADSGGGVSESGGSRADAAATASAADDRHELTERRAQLEARMAKLQSQRATIDEEIEATAGELEKLKGLQDAKEGGGGDT